MHTTQHQTFKSSGTSTGGASLGQEKKTFSSIGTQCDFDSPHFGQKEASLGTFVDDVSLQFSLSEPAEIDKGEASPNVEPNLQPAMSIVVEQPEGKEAQPLPVIESLEIAAKAPKGDRKRLIEVKTVDEIKREGETDKRRDVDKTIHGPSVVTAVRNVVDEPMAQVGVIETAECLPDEQQDKISEIGPQQIDVKELPKSKASKRSKAKLVKQKTFPLSVSELHVCDSSDLPGNDTETRAKLSSVTPKKRRVSYDEKRNISLEKLRTSITDVELTLGRRKSKVREMLLSHKDINYDAYLIWIMFAEGELNNVRCVSATYSILMEQKTYIEVCKYSRYQEIQLKCFLEVL